VSDCGTEEFRGLDGYARLGLGRRQAHRRKWRRAGREVEGAAWLPTISIARPAVRVSGARAAPYSVGDLDHSLTALRLEGQFSVCIVIVVIGVRIVDALTRGNSSRVTARLRDACQPSPATRTLQNARRRFLRGAAQALPGRPNCARSERARIAAQPRRIVITSALHGTSTILLLELVEDSI
jgi:hypothetical protein